MLFEVALHCVVEIPCLGLNGNPMCRAEINFSDLSLIKRSNMRPTCNIRSLRTKESELKILPV